MVGLQQLLNKCNPGGGWSRQSWMNGHTERTAPTLPFVNVHLIHLFPLEVLFEELIWNYNLKVSFSLVCKVRNNFQSRPSFLLCSAAAALLFNRVFFFHLYGNLCATIIYDQHFTFPSKVSFYKNLCRFFLSGYFVTLTWPAIWNLIFIFV